MKKRLYRRTKTGIRIPKEKIQWMPPLEEEPSDDPKLPALSDIERRNLFTRNFNSFLQSDLSAESEGGGEYFGEEGCNAVVQIQRGFYSLEANFTEPPAIVEVIVQGDGWEIL